MIIGIVASFTFLVGGVLGLIVGYETGWWTHKQKEKHS